MDKLTKAAEQHGEVFEMMVIFEKAVNEISDVDSPEHVSNLNNFFDNNIVTHFEYEEKEIFPVVLEKGTEDEKDVVNRLKKDHVRLFEKIDQFKGLIAKYGTYPEDEKVAEISDLGKEIITETIEHGRYEDTDLYPKIKKYL